MQINLGTDFRTKNPIILDTQKTINGHLQISGVTGMGKTHQIRRLVGGALRSAVQSRQPLRFHIFDPHGDMNMPHCSSIKFSEATQYGFNPLEINPDPDFGGVRRAIKKFIAALQKQKKLGSKQEAAVRYLLEDLYMQRGFHPDHPASWIPDDPYLVHERMTGKEDRVYLNVPFEHKDRFKMLTKPQDGKFIAGFDDDPGFKSWWVYEENYVGDLLMWEPKHIFKSFPTIVDLVKFVKLKMKAQLCGSNSAAMALLNDVSQASRIYYRRVEELAKLNKVMEESERAQLEGNLDKAKQNAVDAYSSFLNAVRTGREIDDVIRYNSEEVLNSVYERIQNLAASGIFNPEPPPFDTSLPIWRYDIKYLEVSVQRMLVDLVCTSIFDNAVQRGFQDDVVEVIMIDEGARYATDEEGNILQMISNEARKFGLGLWIASQTPAHFADDFLKSTGTILILGLSAADSRVAANKLGLTDSGLLEKIQPQKTALIQMKNKGELNSKFQLMELSS